MRWALAVGSLVFLASCGDAPSASEHVGRTQSRLSTSLSVTAGASGTVTTLAYYSAGNPHPGENAVDIAAGAGTPVYHQLDYLPSDVAGGWLRTYVTKDAGYCSQWSPGSPYYNGEKLVVVTYLYATDGTYLGWHRSAYQHVSPNASVTDAWFRWNNSGASVPAWQSPDVDLGAQQGNGLALGSVFGVYGDIYNGPGGGLCTTGSHLHQEGMGWRGSALFVGKGLTDRYNDVHLFDPAGGWPGAGAPPWAPEFYVPPVVVEETPRTEETTPPVEETTPRSEETVEQKPDDVQAAPHGDEMVGGGGAGSELASAPLGEGSDAMEGDVHADANDYAATGCTVPPGTSSSDFVVVALALTTALRARRSRRACDA